MRTTTSTLAFLLLSVPAAADALSLTQLAPVDITALGLGSIGDLAFETTAGRLWIVDGTAGGDVIEFSPATGAELSRFDPGSIPGLTQGPDAIAVNLGALNPHLFVFSSFGESAAGRVSQGGTLIANFGTSHGARAADVDATGNLWIACAAENSIGIVLRRLDRDTGAVLQALNVTASGSAVSGMTIDPVSGSCYVVREESNTLSEIDLATGAIVSSSTLSGLPSGTDGGLDFSLTGEFLYLARIESGGLRTLRVFRRDFDATICDGAGQGTPCPCGNSGLPGRGCDNSFATGGAQLDTDGVPRVAADSFELEAAGMPPTTTCLFLQGTTTPESGPTVFGDGHRCVVGNVIRLGTKSTINGRANYPGAGDPDISVRGLVPATGGTRYYQVWYRNVASFCTPSGFNLSNGVVVRWQP